jgi:hypothetical protein
MNSFARDARLLARDAAPAGRRRRLGEEAGQLQPLRFAAGQRRHRLAELHVFEPDVDDRLQHAQHLGVRREEADRFADRQVEHVGDVQRATVALDPHFEDFRAVALPSQSGQRRYTSLRNCISMCSKPEPPQVGQRPSPELKLNVPAP